MKVYIEEKTTSVSMFLEILFCSAVGGIAFNLWGGPV